MQMKNAFEAAAHSSHNKFLMKNKTKYVKQKFG